MSSITVVDPKVYLRFDRFFLLLLSDLVFCYLPDANTFKEKFLEVREINVELMNKTKSKEQDSTKESEKVQTKSEEPKQADKSPTEASV